MKFAKKNLKKKKKKKPKPLRTFGFIRFHYFKTLLFRNDEERMNKDCC